MGAYCSKFLHTYILYIIHVTCILYTVCVLNASYLPDCNIPDFIVCKGSVSSSDCRKAPPCFISFMQVIVPILFTLALQLHRWSIFCYIDSTNCHIMQFALCGMCAYTFYQHKYSSCMVLLMIQNDNEHKYQQ